MKNDLIEKCLDSTDGSEDAVISCQEKLVSIKKRVWWFLGYKNSFW